MINLEIAKNSMSKEDYERFKDLYDRIVQLELEVYNEFVFNTIS